MSRGNAEQPSAQTPKGPGSPNRVETAVQGRPESGPQGRPEAGVQNGPQPGVQDRQRPGPQGNPQARNPQDGAKGDSKGAGPQGGGAQGGGAQGGNPQGRGPQGGSPQAGNPQSGSPQARVAGPQGRPQQPNAQQPNAQQPRAQQPPQRTPDVKTPRHAAARRGAVGSEANGRTGRRYDREGSGRGAQEFQRAERPRRAGCSDAYGRRSCCSWRRRTQASGAAVRPPLPGGPRPAGPASGGTAQPKQAPNQQPPNQQAQATKQQPPAKTATQGASAVSTTQPRPTTSSSPAGPGAPTIAPGNRGRDTCLGSACASTAQAVAPRSTGVWEEDRAGGERLRRSTRTAGTDATDLSHSAAEPTARNVQADDVSARRCSATAAATGWWRSRGHGWPRAAGSYASATAAWNPTFAAGWRPGDFGESGRGRWPDRGGCYCGRNDTGASAGTSAAGYVAVAGSCGRHHWRVRPEFRATRRRQRRRPYPGNRQQLRPYPGSKLGCQRRRQVGLRDRSRCQRRFKRSGKRRRRTTPWSRQLLSSPRRPKTITVQSRKWALPGEPGRRGCGSRVSTRGR